MSPKDTFAIMAIIEGAAYGFSTGDAHGLDTDTPPGGYGYNSVSFRLGLIRITIRYLVTVTLACVYPGIVRFVIGTVIDFVNYVDRSPQHGISS